MGYYRRKLITGLANLFDYHKWHYYGKVTNPPKEEYCSDYYQYRICLITKTEQTFFIEEEEFPTSGRWITTKEY